MKMFASVAILTVVSTCAFAQDSALSFTDEQIAQMCNYNRHRRTGFERFTRDGPVPPQPDAITGFAKRNGLALEEVGEAVFARVSANLSEQRFKQAFTGLGVLIDCDPAASRAHLAEFRDWALHAKDPEVRFSSLMLVLDAEGTDALPFVESAFSPDLLPTTGRILLCNRFRRFVAANGPKKLPPEERAVWNAFLTRLVEREHEPEVFRKLDSVMVSNVEGWRFSERRLALRELRREEFALSAPSASQSVARSLELDRIALSNGETNSVLSWQVEPIDWSKAKVFDMTAEELRRSLPETEPGR